MNTAYEAHQQSLLEPTDRLIAGNEKRWGLLYLPPTRRVVEVMQPVVVLDEQTDNERQDAYLERCGIK